MSDEKIRNEKLEDRLKIVLEVFSRYEFERILDVGCGNGNFTVLIGKACKAKEIYGLDISEKYIEMARKIGIKVFRLDVDSEDFPFKDNYFDAVFAGEIIEHLYDPDHLLDEVYRVLKKDGILILTTPNLACWQNRISLLLGFQPYATTVSLRYRVGHIFGDSDVLPREIIQSRRHISVFTLKALIRLLRRHNFSILDIKNCPIELFSDYMKFSFFNQNSVRY